MIDWTREDDYICCVAFLECYCKNKKRAISVSDFTDILEDKLPELTRSSIYNKIGNIKALCKEENISNYADITPIYDNISQQHREEFYRALQTMDIPKIPLTISILFCFFGYNLYSSLPKVNGIFGNNTSDYGTHIMVAISLYVIYEAIHTFREYLSKNFISASNLSEIIKKYTFYIIAIIILLYVISDNSSTTETPTKSPITTNNAGSSDAINRKSLEKNNYTLVTPKTATSDTKTYKFIVEDLK